MSGLPDATKVDLLMVIAQVEAELQLAGALRDSHELRRRVLGERSVLVGKLPSDAWIRVTVGSFELTRHPPLEHDATETLPFEQILGRTADELEVEPSQPRTGELIRTLFRDDRGAFRQLLEWAPLIEHSSYKLVARMSTALDQMRAAVHTAVRQKLPQVDELVTVYHRFVLALGRTTLLSTDSGSAWLAGLAARFNWIRWTPSFPLIRERDMWSAAIAARSASRFGPLVIDAYLAAFRRSRHPMYALDSLIALVAIGLRHPGEREALLDSLDREMALLPSREILRRDIVEAAYGDARRAMLGELPKHLGGPSRLHNAFALDAAHRVPIFQLIGDAIGLPAHELIPTLEREKTPSVPRARERFIDAWGPGDMRLEDFPPSAFGHA
ncbi:hypothetical protein [uncultured Nevskia sp.]|uniref:hypothetical protein n=1 Tax=uncultured Nevskia sp. TaxID=228950 RepID=UPI0025CFD2BF|nr:hypothetical protein [uncultured Nevskia sp.]